MAMEQGNDSKHNFTLSTDIFQEPHLDIYSQMVYIVLKSYSSEASLPALNELSRHGRMTIKQATKALQSLVEYRLLPVKFFRQMVGEFADDRLSWAAKGLLTYCKERPQLKFNDLMELSSQSGESEHTIRKALKDLKQYGYLEEYPELSKIAN